MRTLIRSLTTVLIFSFLVASLPALGAPPPGRDPARAIQSKLAYWKKRHNDEQVIRLLKDLLRLQPDNHQARSELCETLARVGRKDEAKKCVAKLKTCDATPAELGRLDGIVEKGSARDKLVQEARALMKAKRVPEAIAKYREAFGGTPPSGALALEFYTTLAGTSGGWAEANKGLRRLVAENPGSPTFELELAKNLTYSKAGKHRHEGIKILRKLSQIQGHPKIQKEARRAWKETLSWVKANPANASLLQAYLKEVGEDKDVRQWLKALQSRKSAFKGTPKADKALKKGDVSEAERLYDETLKREPNNVKALMGKADIAMKRADYDDAVAYLNKVRRIIPGQWWIWYKFRQEALFWQQVTTAKGHMKRAEYSKAEATLDKALKLVPKNAPKLDELYGNVYMAQGRRAEARKKFEAVVSRDPNAVGALSALMQMALRDGRVEDARALSARIQAVTELPKAAPDHPRHPDRLAVTKLQAQATLARKDGKPLEALRLLEKARQHDPRNTWLLLDLVDLYLSQRDVVRARYLVDEVMKNEPELVEARKANVRVLLAEERHSEAFEVIAGLPGEEVDPAWHKLKRELGYQSRARLLVTRFYHGETIKARHGLTALEREVDAFPEYIGYVALAWSDIGEHQRAMSLMRRAIVLSPKPDINQQLQLAAILLRGQRYTELTKLLNDMGWENKLTPRQMEDFTRLRIALVLQQVETARLDKRFDDAFAHLRPLLEDHPEETEVLLMLGMLFLDINKPRDARAVYLRVLNRDERNHDAREGAIRAAMALGEIDEARLLIDEGVTLTPESARMELVAARLAMLEGDDAEADELLHRALHLLEQSRQDTPPAAPLNLHSEHGQVELDADSEYGDILRVAYLRFQGAAERKRQTTIHDRLEHEIHVELQNLEARHSGSLGLNPYLRYRGGEAGLGRLTELAFPVSVELPLGYYGFMRLSARPLMLWSGELDVANMDKGDRFGRIGTVTLSKANDPRPIGTRGVGVELAYRFRGFEIYGGTTPMGFPIQTFVGGLSWGGGFGPFSLYIGGYRRPITDSLLSYSGATDPLSGQTWGQVTANGLRIEGSLAFDEVMFYLYGGHDWLFGTDVQDNRELFGGTGLRWLVHQERGVKVKTGISFGVMSYQNNVRHFTWGHGGYFSPQLFLNGGIPLIIQGDKGRVVYLFEGDAGVNWFHEDEVDYYLGDDAAMARRAPKRNLDNEPVPVVYEGQDSLGFGLNARGHVGYRFSTRFVGGLEAQAHYAADYTEMIVGLFIGYGFNRGSNPTPPVMPRLHR
jgi:cellulose synthase operon protein C